MEKNFYIKEKGLSDEGVREIKYVELDVQPFF